MSVQPVPRPGNVPEQVSMSRRRSMARVPWLYVAFAVALIASPFAFLPLLLVGAAVVIAGVFIYAMERQQIPLTVGLGLVLGSLPYPILGLLQNL